MARADRAFAAGPPRGLNDGLHDHRRRRFLRAALTAALAPSSMLAACSRITRPALAARPGFDAHAHLVTQALADEVTRRDPEEHWRAIDGSALLGSLAGDGIRQALAVSCAYVWASDFPPPVDPFGGTPQERDAVQAENDFTLAQAARYPRRLWPVCSVNPKRSYALDEVERCVEAGARGLKLHLWNSNVSLREPRDLEALRGVLEYAASREVPVLLHLLNGEVEDFGATDVGILADEVVAPMSGLRLCFAHLGGAGGYDAQVTQIVDALVDRRTAGSFHAEHTWLDLSAVFATADAEATSFASLEARRRLAAQLRAWGPGRLLWGSDNEPDYLEATRAGWPLREEEWQVIAGHRWTEVAS